MQSKKKLAYKIIPLALSSIILYGCSSGPEFIVENNKTNTETKVEDIDKNYSIVFFGDLLMHNSVYDTAKTSDGYDFTNQFTDIKDKIIDSDFRVGNLEVPTAGKELGYSNYPSFNCPEQLLDALRDTLKVDLVTNATNHSLDKGYKGLVNTIDFLDQANIDHIGTYKDEESSKEIYIKELDNGIKIAFLNYTYGTNGIPMPKDHPYSVNLINKEKIVADSNKAKELGADFIIAKLHWGTEYQKEENSEQENLAKYLFENSDISLIVGDHPHVVQNIEQISVERNGEEKTGTVIYSLGNFISGQKDRYKNTGLICKVNLYINKTNPEKTKVENVEYTPVYVDWNAGSSTKRCRVVDVNKAISDYENDLDPLINKSEYNELVYARDYYRNKLLQDNFVIEN